jgi:CubicO group peptidase (beta-lactamase class C family)
MARTWLEMGIMQGSPPPDDARVTLANYDRASNVRWSVINMRQLIPSARVARGAASTPIPRSIRDLGAVRFEHGGVERGIDDLLSDTFVDAMMVVHHGEVVIEHFDEGVGPDSRHIAQSVTKSVVGTLTGVLVGRGVLVPAERVTTYLPELAGTAWDGATLQQLLDMRTGTAFDESDYEDADSESTRGFRVIGWFERRPDDPLPHEYIAGLPNCREHGAAFEYRSILTDVIGWVLERVTGRTLADLLSTEVWGPMGAGHDADLLVGPLGFPLSDGGLCLTLEDLARFGLMHLRGGRIEGHQVVPQEWVRSITTDDDGLAVAFAADEHRRCSGPAASTTSSGGCWTAPRASAPASASTGSRYSCTRRRTR